MRQLSLRPLGGSHNISLTTLLLLLGILSCLPTPVKSDCYWPSGNVTSNQGQCWGANHMNCCKYGDFCLDNKVCAHPLDPDNDDDGGDSKTERFSFYRGACWYGREWNETLCGTFCHSEDHPDAQEELLPMEAFAPPPDDPRNKSYIEEMQNWWYCKGQPPPKGFYADPWYYENAFSLTGEWKIVASGGLHASGSELDSSITPIPAMYTRSPSANGNPTTATASGSADSKGSETSQPPAPGGMSTSDGSAAPTPTDSAAQDSSESSNNNDNNNNSQVIAIAVGTSVGTIVVVAILVLATMFILKKKRRQKAAEEAAADANNTSPPDDANAYNNEDMHKTPLAPYGSPSVGSPGLSELPTPEVGHTQWNQLHGDSAHKYELQSAENMKYELQGQGGGGQGAYGNFKHHELQS